MKKYSQEELNEVIWLHELWLAGKRGGVNADLRSADLRGACLRYADLRGVNLRVISPD